MADIIIEEYRKSDLEEIKSLIFRDINYFPEVSSVRHGLLLLENKIIIGVGLLWDNPVHPYRSYISVYIVPDKRSNGLGELLFRELESRFGLKQLQTAFDSDNISAVNFAKKCGFKLVRKSYCYNVNEKMLKPSDDTDLAGITRLCNLSEDQLGI